MILLKFLVLFIILIVLYILLSKNFHFEIFLPYMFIIILVLFIPRFEWETKRIHYLDLNYIDEGMEQVVYECPKDKGLVLKHILGIDKSRSNLFEKIFFKDLSKKICIRSLKLRMNYSHFKGLATTTEFDPKKNTYFMEKCDKDLWEAYMNKDITKDQIKEQFESFIDNFRNRSLILFDMHIKNFMVKKDEKSEYKGEYILKNVDGHILEDNTYNKVFFLLGSLLENFYTYEYNGVKLFMAAFYLPIYALFSQNFKTCCYKCRNTDLSKFYFNNKMLIFCESCRNLSPEKNFYSFPNSL